MYIVRALFYLVVIEKWIAMGNLGPFLKCNPIRRYSLYRSTNRTLFTYCVVEPQNRITFPAIWTQGYIVFL